MKVMSAWSALPILHPQHIGPWSQCYTPESICHKPQVSAAATGLKTCSNISAGNGRYATVDRVERAAALVDKLSADWHTELGWQLPEFPFVLHLRCAEDPDEEAIPFPSCCTLSPTGINLMPIHAATMHVSLDHIAGEHNAVSACLICLALHSPYSKACGTAAIPDSCMASQMCQVE